MELVFLTLRPLGPISQIFDALFEKIAFALIGLNLGAKFLNFGLQHTGFRGCLRCFTRGCNSLHGTVSVPVSIFPPFQLGRVYAVGTVIQTFCAELPVFYRPRKRWLTETGRFRSFS